MLYIFCPVKPSQRCTHSRLHYQTSIFLSKSPAEMRAGIQLVIMKLTSHLYLRFLHQTEQNYWATSLAFLSHWILHLRFYGENQAHAQAFLGHLLDTSGGGIPLRVARRATIITSLLFLFLPPVHCCSTVYSPPERAEGARDGRILSPCSSLLLHWLSSRSVSRRSQSTVRALPLLLLLISIGVEPAGQ